MKHFRVLKTHSKLFFLFFFFHDDTGPADYFPKIENTGPKWGMRRKFKESKTESNKTIIIFMYFRLVKFC